MYCHKDISRAKNRPAQAASHLHQLHDGSPAGKVDGDCILFAGFWKRFGAGFLDCGFALILAITAGVICELLQYSAMDLIAMGTALLVYFFIITPLMISSRYRASPGKIVFCIVVTDTAGKTLTFSRALLRELGKYVSLLPAGAGFFLIGFSRMKQGLHDILTDAVVVGRPDAHLLCCLSPARSAGRDRLLLCGTIIICGAVLCSAAVVFSFSHFYHKEVTPASLAAHSFMVAADTVADTKYPGYSLPLYDTAMSLEPEDSGIMVKKVTILGKEGRTAEAQTILNKAMIANPNDTVPVVISGDLRYSSGDYQSAIGYYEKALGMNREDAEVWIRKGDACLAISVVEMEKMRKQYRSLTDNDPITMESDAQTMDAFRSTESYRQAIDAYNEAIKIDPFTSVEISGRVLASTQALLTTYQGILDDIGIDNSTANQSVDMTVRK